MKKLIFGVIICAMMAFMLLPVAANDPCGCPDGMGVNFGGGGGHQLATPTSSSPPHSSTTCVSISPHTLNWRTTSTST